MSFDQPGIRAQTPHTKKCKGNGFTLGCWGFPSSARLEFCGSGKELR
uniref:Uncharacterized protein n=1 Tax=Rhizophora mucronata TaxID=61149 RepID=A0A2P2R4F4_RHIMU